MDVQFGAYRLKVRERQLLGPEGPVSLDGRAIDVLRALLGKPNELVMKDEIFSSVWPGVAVGENTLQVHISSLRKALGPDLIETVHGRGYKYRGALPEILSADPAPKPGGEYPLVAILPFKNVDNDPHLRSFCEGLSEQLIEQLSRFPFLSVVPHLVEPAAATGESGEGASSRPGFLLSGDVRRAGNRVRAGAKLQDARNRVVFWAEHYDRALDDPFAVLDELSGMMAGRINTRIESHMAARLLSERPVTSYDHVIKGIWHFRLQTAEGPTVAEQLFRKARDLNPANAEAIRWLSIRATCVWLAEHRREALREGLALGRAAAELDPSSATCHAAHGFAALWAENLQAACDSFRKAYDANPNDGYMLADVGLCALYRGRLDEASAMLDRAAQLNPFPSDWHSQYRSMVLFAGGQYAEAIPGLQRLPLGVFNLIYLVACHGLTGNRDGVLALAPRLAQVNCDLEQAAREEPFSDRATAERLAEGVRKGLALAR